tara:strand:+ start:4055 stop:4366 length:312 start_codon:yes stop_codon:yes gene_type:complete
MAKKIMKTAGVYKIKGKTYKQLRGARSAVWHGNAYKTSGGLTKSMLVKNKHGRYVSKKKHHIAKKEKRLEKAGYFAKKGKFGFVYKGTKSRRRRVKGTKRRRR